MTIEIGETPVFMKFLILLGFVILFIGYLVAPNENNKECITYENNVYCKEGDE